MNDHPTSEAAPAAEEASTSPRSLPNSPRAQLLCELFAAVLKVPSVGMDDDFFKRGGHSLLATRLVSRIRSMMKLRLTVRDLFEAPSVRKLVQLLSNDANAADDSGLLDPVVPINPGSNDRPLFCVHPITGLSWSYAALLPQLGFTHPVYGLQSSGITAPAELASSMVELVAGYVTRIRETQPHGPYRLIGWSLGGVLAQAIAVALREQDEEVSLLALIDAYPFPDQRIYVDAPESDEDHDQFILESLLVSFGGFVQDDPNVTLKPSDVIERMVEALELKESDGAALVDAALHSSRLADTHVPDRFAGRVVFFAAAEGNPEGLSVAVWEKYVDGPVEEHRIPADHHSMLSTPAAAEIGRILAAELAAE
ncbi:MAG TPA: hypothetical protein DEQ61_19595 [Streptomyces sp.]|nr:hypothetical protein [Streptomyces sp.]